jgi:hypothetical protein
MQQFFRCRVCGHMFEFERMENEDGTGWDEDFGDDIDVTIWYPGLQRLSWRERINAFWRLIRGKMHMGEHVTLKADEAADMGRYLLALSHRDDPRGCVNVSATANANITYADNTDRTGGTD